MNKIAVMQGFMEGQVLGISFGNKKNNVKIRNTSKVMDVIETIPTLKWN